MKILKVPLYKQKPGTCGPTSLRMVLAFYGIKKSNQELARLTKCRPHWGTEAKNIAHVAKSFGLHADVKDYATISDLKKWYKKNVPVIVAWFFVDEGHYSVVAKIDDKFIWLLEPWAARIKKLDLETFKKIWFDTPARQLKSKDDVIIRRIIVIQS